MGWRNIPPKVQFTFNKLHDVVSQNLGTLRYIYITYSERPKTTYESSQLWYTESHNRVVSIPSSFLIIPESNLDWETDNFDVTFQWFSSNIF
jgi:hypothetical protein